MVDVAFDPPGLGEEEVTDHGNIVRHCPRFVTLGFRCSGSDVRNFTHRCASNASSCHRPKDQSYVQDGASNEVSCGRETGTVQNQKGMGQMGTVFGR